MKLISAFKFCPSCKTPLKKLNNRLVDCQRCGFHYYFNPAVTNAAIIENEKGEILLVKRKFPPKKGFWDLPGGFVEINETIETSIKREIKEELGINLLNLKYFSSYTGHYYYKGLDYPTLCYVFLGKIDNQKPKASDDAQELRFFKKEKIPFKRLAFIEIKNALRDYLSFKKIISP